MSNDVELKLAGKVSHCCLALGTSLSSSAKTVLRGAELSPNTSPPPPQAPKPHGCPMHTLCCSTGSCPHAILADPSEQNLPRDSREKPSWKQQRAEAS